MLLNNTSSAYPSWFISEDTSSRRNVNDTMDTISIGEPLVATAPLPTTKLQCRNAYQPSLVETVNGEEGTWKPNMTLEERRQRRRWLSKGRGRKGLRIMIVTENFLPKVDGVTRTLARLLTHLEAEGHECMVLGPQTGMVSGHYQAFYCYQRRWRTEAKCSQSHYASHPLVGTLGVPLVLYPGLKVIVIRRCERFKLIHFLANS